MAKDFGQYLVNIADVPYVRESTERVLTGFPDLDFFNKGIETGLTEIIGATNTGKSVLTASLISKAIDQHYKVGVFAGEHSLKTYKQVCLYLCLVFFNTLIYRYIAIVYVYRYV